MSNRYKNVSLSQSVINRFLRRAETAKNVNKVRDDFEQYVQRKRNEAQRNKARREARQKFFARFRRTPTAPPPPPPPSGNYTARQLKMLNQILHNIEKQNMNKTYAHDAKRRHNKLLKNVNWKNDIFLTKVTRQQLKNYRNRLNQILNPAYPLPLQNEAYPLPLLRKPTRATLLREFSRKHPEVKVPKRVRTTWWKLF